MFRMSKCAYFAEFIVLPGLLGALTIAACNFSEASLLGWLLAFFAGVAVWPPLEYLIHRIAFHHVQPFVALHLEHHQAPLALIGAPPWASVVAAILVLLPLWSLIGLPAATGATAGLSTGYLFYVLVHYAVHHRRPKRGSYLQRAQVRHLRHHHMPESGNFGVTTGLWDRCFGTVIGRVSRGDISAA